MKRSNRRRFSLMLGTLLVLSGLPARCLAVDVLKELSREEATKLGITVDTKPRQASGDVLVQVEFKPTGSNKQPAYINLDVSQGGKRLVYAALMPYHPTPDTTRFGFYINPDALQNASIVVTEVGAPVRGHGYVLHMREYMPDAASR